MWSYCVEFLDEIGQKVESFIVTARNRFHAEDLAGMKVQHEYASVQATRL